jgi:hypothetical protein
MRRFQIPSAITHPLAKEMRRKHMPRFEVSQQAKMRC